jgi:hypothetical protein
MAMDEDEESAPLEEGAAPLESPADELLPVSDEELVSVDEPMSPDDEPVSASGLGPGRQAFMTGVAQLASCTTVCAPVSTSVLACPVVSLGS